MRRREFIEALGALSAACLMPHRLILPKTASRTRSLIIVDLQGGNDGLNTVIPFRDPIYARSRPTLAIPKDQVIPVGEDVGLHPALLPLKNHFKKGRMAIVRSVGPMHPNRSHFRSREIWATGVPDREDLSSGWLGRASQAMDRESRPPAVALFHLATTPPPLAFKGAAAPVAGLETLDDLTIRADRRRLEEVLREAKSRLRGDSAADRPTRAIIESCEGILRFQHRLKAARDRKPPVPYPDDILGRRLQTAAALLETGFERIVGYVEQDGYDTHVAQANTHALLLGSLANSLAAFLADLESSGRLDDTTIMVFSEFGRRVEQNAGQGTDHGAGNPVLVLGGRVRGGLKGSWPGLRDLLDGDVRPTTDFRHVQAACLAHALGLRHAGQVAHAPSAPGRLDLFR